MIEIKIDQNEANKRIDNFLSKKFNVSKTLIFKLIRSKKIKVNNKIVENNYRTNLNDVIQINYVFEQKKDTSSKNNKYSFNFKTKLNIIYEDENILLINKPIGILSQPNSDNDLSIQNLFLDYLIKTKQFIPNNDTFVPSICNRLDFNTSGIIIAAKNNQSLTEINELIKQHKIDKFYKVLVFNKPLKNEDTLVAYHYKDNKNNLVYIKDKPTNGYKEIITKYKVLKSNNKWSLLEIHLITGKTHQIRAHLNHINLNVVGDNKYKSKNDNYDSRFKTQALVSYKIKFNVNKDFYLSYLNNREFEIKDIWFEKYF